MEQKMNLKALEKNTAGGIFQTGLVDIEIGLILLVSALSMLFDDIRYYLNILYVVPIIFILLAVKYISTPRMGMVNLARKRVNRNRKVWIVMTTFLVIMVTFTIFGDASAIDELINPRWIILGIIFSICTAIGYFLNFERMYFYAFVIAGTFNLSEEIREHDWFISSGGYAYLLAAIILITVGLFYLIKFLKKYPLPKEEVNYEG